jgi:hypothetical protein
MALKAVAGDTWYDAMLGEILVLREASMSDELARAKAEVCLDQLNRRTRLLGIVQKTAPGHWSFWSLSAMLLTALVFAVLTYVLLQEGTFSSSILSLVVGSLVGIKYHIVALHKQVDALVELLREEGVLQSTPPVAKLLEKQ